MHYQYAIRPIRIIIFALLCFLATACATTQKSSSGQGLNEPAASPVSDVAMTQAAKAQGPTSAPTDAVAMSTQTSTQPEAAAAASAATPDGSPQVSTTGISSEDVDRAKAQLAEEEARINKLRDAQEMARRRMEADAAKQQAEEAAASASASAPAVAATHQPASRVAATKADDEIAVFPSSKIVANENASQPADQRPLQRSVYFDFDDSTIKDKYDHLLMTHAANLKSHPDTRTEIQGNCDERGSREYNLALGARRAEAVKRALELLGVNGAKIKTVSFGSEKPVAPGNDEASYSQNRRADIFD